MLMDIKCYYTEGCGSLYEDILNIYEFLRNEAQIPIHVRRPNECRTNFRTIIRRVTENYKDMYGTQVLGMIACIIQNDTVSHENLSRNLTESYKQIMGA